MKLLWAWLKNLIGALRSVSPVLHLGADLSKVVIPGVNNPYKDPGFRVSVVESYGQGSNAHKVGQIKIFYKLPLCATIISFYKKDGVLAWACLDVLIGDGFSYAPGTRVYFDGRLTNLGPLYETFDNPALYLKLRNEFFLNLHLSDAGLHRIKIVYADSDEGREAFTYNKQCCIWTIDAFHEDEYFLSQELERWKRVESGLEAQINEDEDAVD